MLFACGLPSVLAVAFGGLAIGVLFWAFALRDIGLGSSFAFVAMSLVGVFVAGVMWLAPAAYVARGGRTDLVPLLRSDAIAWGVLGIVITGGSIARQPTATNALLGTIAFTIARFAAKWRTSTSIRDAAFAFGLSRLSVFGIGYLAYLSTARTVRVPYGFLTPWLNWDGLHYLAIAKHGYVGTDMVFFPLYPALIRIFTPAVWYEPAIAAVLVSNAAFFFALLYLHKIVAREYDDAVAKRSTLLIAVFPTSFFFSAAYTESLFLALTIAALYYLQEHRWTVAGVLGGFAALTRVEGVLLVAPYLVEIFAPGSGLLQQMRASRAVRRQLFMGIAMIPLGLLTYMVLLLLLCGDPLYFSHAQAHWSRSLAFPWIGVRRAIELIAHSGNLGTIEVQSVELLFSGLSIGILILGARILPPAQRVYAALSLLLPLSTSTLMSMPRFFVVVFPLFTILAVWAARERLYTVMLGLSMPFLGFFVALFTTGRWVA